MTELLTLIEVAERLHCSVRKVQRIIAHGELRVVRIGGRRLITVREYEAYLAAAARRAA